MGSGASLRSAPGVGGTMTTAVDGDARWMRLAIEKAREGVAAGQTPFGACIVRGATPVAIEHNVVLATTDIPAHAEVTALRAACRAVGGIDRACCGICSTCDRCPV